MKDNKTFYLGSDHAGYKLKGKIKDFLDELGYKYIKKIRKNMQNRT